MLTVMREMADSGRDSPTASAARATLLRAVARPARWRSSDAASSRRCAQAGVVDAGGYGLLVLFQGLAGRVARAQAERAAPTSPCAAVGSAAARSRHRRAARRRTSEPPRYRYCTSFLLSGERARPRRSRALRRRPGRQRAGRRRRHACSRSTCTPTIPGRCSASASARRRQRRRGQRHARADPRARRAPARGRDAAGAVVVAVVAGDGNKRALPRARLRSASSTAGSR